MFAIYRESTITRKHWEELLRCRQDFLDRKIRDAGGLTCLKPEVADSWVRCRRAGVDPYAAKPEKTLNGGQLKQVKEGNLRLKRMEQVKKDNALLIAAIKPLLENLRLEYRLPFSIDDDNKTPLLFLNDGYSLDYIEAQGDGILGTSAHELSKLYKRPFQLLGPEHFCDFCCEFVVTAAPVLSKTEETQAILVSVKPLFNRPWDTDFQRICSITFSQVAAIAAAIQNRMWMMKSHQDLENAHNRLQTTLTAINQGIVTIDKNGTIVDVNPEGRRILRLENCDDTTNPSNIKSFLGQSSQLMSSVLSGHHVALEEVISVHNDEQSYLIRNQPIVNKHSGQAEGAVLLLEPLEKINVQAVNRAGSNACFTFDSIIGQSPGFLKAIERAQLFAQSPENVLLTGESGTGKEMFAQSIHNNDRPDGPFMAVNCAAMPRELIESELFGYEGGSFTGADRKGRPGKIELANGGTLFLDEIGDMPYELQAVLLRVLQDKQVMRIGGQRYRKVDFRIIAATNKSLPDLIRDKLFRADLFYRLSVLSVEIPPLRHREGDIEILCKHIVNNYCRKMNIRIPRIHPATRRALNDCSWPGNVRQLENAMIYAVNIARSEVILPEHLPAGLLTDSSAAIPGEPAGDAPTKKFITLRDAEKTAIESALVSTGANMALTARCLGISKSTLYRKLREYKIDI